MWQCDKCGRDFKSQNQSHSCIGKPSSIDEYIEAQSADIQPMLNKIRQTIKKAAPKSMEKMSWRMPTFWQNENLIHFAAFRKHIGIYPGDLTEMPFANRLAEYSTSKGAIQFPLDKPIDYNLISDITKYRVSVAVKKVIKCKN
jgi:uncharacterized protein YdhG (YjbR/CyaY superfamily)